MALSGVRIYGIMRKEFKHILRDWQTLMIVIAMPLVMMFLYGFALTLDIHDLAVMVQAQPDSRAARHIIRSIDASDMFAVISVRRHIVNPLDTIRKYHSKALIILPADLDRRLESRTSPADISVYIDGSDPNTGTLLRNMIKPFIQNSLMEYLGFDPPKVVRIRPYILYNPHQESALFFVPGLMALILIMLSTLMTSLTLTREKERGTMQQLLISPLAPSEIIIGKILPYTFLALLDAFIILLAGHLFFRVRVQGSYLFLALCTVVYVVSSLGLGLIFSTVAKNQIQAIFMALPATMLPSMILSGFIFPVSSMPLFLRAVSRIIPATYYLECIRGIILKGAGPLLLWKPLLALCGIGLFFIAVAIKRFKVRL